MTELTRWGRSTIDLFHTLGELQVWGISLIGLQFDLGTPQGKLIVSLMSVLAEFERDLASRAGALGHCRSASARRALELVAAGQSYREVGLRLGISKNTVLAIVKRHRAEQVGP